MSHVASGVYNIPTAVVTSHDILHWLPPRGNVRALVVPTVQEFLLHGVPLSEFTRIRERGFNAAVEAAGEFAREIGQLPERAEAKIAKAAAASAAERAFMDEELCDASRPMKEAEENVRSFLKGYLTALELHRHLGSRGIRWEELIPPVMFVDSAAQAGVGLPRFQSKLHTRADGTTVLLVDVSALEEKTAPDGAKTVRVNEECKKNHIAHEVAGHMVARALFPQFGRPRNRALNLSNREEELLSTVEEVLARMITFLAAYKMHTQAGMPLDGPGKRAMAQIRNAAGVDAMINIAIRYVSRISRNECLSTYRYYEQLKRRGVAEAVRSSIRQHYILPVLEMFGDFFIPNPDRELNKEMDPLRENEPFTTCS